MGKALAKLTEGRRSDLPRKDKLRPEEARALAKLQSEAKAQGSFLSSGGKGGLPPSLVLGVIRRDDYKCKSCGEKGDEKKNGGIGVHHKGGIVASKWLSKQGHANTPANLVTICKSCHDREHTEAKADGIDSSQVLPEGDKGNPRRDRGQPAARPPT